MKTLFAAAVFVAAALVFLVQPMAAKRLLPLFGGSPGVWNASVVFFQLVLLAGYALSHLMFRVLPLRRQVLVQLGIAASVLLVQPFALAAELPGTWPPAGRILLILAVSVGLPYLSVTTASPVLQRWYAELRAPGSEDPYFLYVASNAGSLFGLLAFPVIVEPRISTTGQATAWMVGYVAYIATLGICALLLLRVRRGGSRVPPAVLASAGGEVIGNLRRLRWVLVAALPSSLMLGVTNHVTTDVANAPLLWIVPLALYLLSFIVTFGRRWRVDVPLASHWAGMAVIVIVLMQLGAVALPSLWRIALHLVAMFVGAVLAHAWLHRDRPQPSQLTLFYLLLSTGGVIGGAFTALLAPALFDRVVEYPLLLAPLLALRIATYPSARFPRSRTVEVGLAFVLVVAVAFPPLRERLFALPESSVRDSLVIAGILVVLALGRWGLTFAAAGLLAFAAIHTPREPLHRERNFFGVLRVEAEGDLVRLHHGTTLHGSQFRDARRRGRPTTYYSRPGPLGDVFERLQQEREFATIGVIGLGAGTVAAYGRQDQTIAFYEIDPAVVRIARNPELFTYLRQSAARIEVVEGDARLRIAEAEDGTYDLMVLDAYSSDAIPVHLLTVEAVELYLRKLAEGGVMAVHVSSRYIDVPAVVAAIAGRLDLRGAYRADPATTREHSLSAASPSVWIVLARQRERLLPLFETGNWWELAPVSRAEPWTDRHSAIVDVLRWPR